MPDIFLIADLHFSQEGACKWLNSDGTKMRPFESAFEMDEVLIANWNKVVSPSDKVYVLGDVAMKKSAVSLIGQCNGKKVLVKGNHDIYKLSDYTPYFYDIRGSHKLDNFILTHIPLHPDSLARWCGGNIHGHLHSGNVDYIDWHREYGDTVDPRYFCVSVEQINYTPIAFEEVKRLMKENNNDSRKPSPERSNYL